ncbi:hypothetical protein BY458DRAFT_589878 [Sporodiniella umbellata]|nr:hypothetical protein BY458DRAFT_589878 [Sporodiniella umbellata]
MATAIIIVVYALGNIPNVRRGPLYFHIDKLFFNIAWYTLSSRLLYSLPLWAADFASISECPSLAPRTSPPKDVTDVRVDDIKIVASLGDSIMAGFGMMGINNGKGGTGIFNFSAIMEFRGNSYAIGGDDGAVTIANFVKHYSPKLIGPSTSSHLTSICYGPLCIPPLNRYIPKKDRFNAAQGGAQSINLNSELDYLIAGMKNEFLHSKRLKDEWKLITIQIGGNDQCVSCNPLLSSTVTPESYGRNVEAAIERIQRELPNTIVNLMGNFKASGLKALRANQDAYCKTHLPLQDEIECICLSVNNLARMDEMVDGYNQKLELIAKKYSGKPGGSFAVMYSPAPIDLPSFPIDALSKKGHQWIAKVFWNQLFTSRSLKPPVFKFTEDLKIRCPTDDDRFPTTNV